MLIAYVSPGTSDLYDYNVRSPIMERGVIREDGRLNEPVVEPFLRSLDTYLALTEARKTSYDEMVSGIRKLLPIFLFVFAVLFVNFVVYLNGSLASQVRVGCLWPPRLPSTQTGSGVATAVPSHVVVSNSCLCCAMQGPYLRPSDLAELNDPDATNEYFPNRTQEQTRVILVVIDGLRFDCM